MAITLRPARPCDAEFLTLMLAEAAFWLPEGPRDDVREVMAQPELAHYIEDWPRPGDTGVVGEEAGRPVGAAWLHRFGADGPVEFRHETVAVDLPLVTYDTFSREVRTGRETRTREVFVFRALEQIVASLERAGFTHIEAVGDWDRFPVGERSPELTLIAQSPAG